MTRPLNRITPNLPSKAYQTFQVKAPKGGYTKATCEEVECEQYARGWRIQVDLNTDLGQKQAHYIKHLSGRSYRVADQRDGLVTLEFRPGQPCFQEHKVRNDLPETFLVRGGDHRGNPLGIKPRVHTRAEYWVEEFAEHQDKLKTQIERG